MLGGQFTNNYLVIALIVAFVTPTLAGFGVVAWKGLRRFVRFMGRRLVIEPLQAGVHEIIDREVAPKFEEIRFEQKAVHERIDSHMGAEEGSFDQFTAQIAAVKEQLNERSPLFDELRDTMKQTQGVLMSHMAADEQQFVLSSDALKKGQQELLGSLATISERLESIEQTQAKE